MQGVRALAVILESLTACTRAGSVENIKEELE